jgi:hypothetical protein
MSAKTCYGRTPRRCCFRNKKRNGYGNDIFSVTLAQMGKQQQRLTTNQPCYASATTRRV